MNFRYLLSAVMVGGTFVYFGILNAGARAQNHKTECCQESEISVRSNTASEIYDSQSEIKRPKKVSILGDSYSTFEGYVVPDTNLVWYKPVPKEGRPTDVTKPEQTWWQIFLDKNGYELERNNSYSGSTVCNTGYGGRDYTDQSFVTRLTDLGDPDMILIFGGTNDSWADSPIGDYVWSGWTDQQLYSYRPATAYMLSELRTLHPDAEIIVLINDQVKDVVKTSTAEICDHYGVEWVQLEDIEKMSDHPDAKGMQQIAEQLNRKTQLK